MEIPADIFFHYLLPLRVNNENLDSFRIKYYDELNYRIKGLDTKSAALEINRWCHEKVTYQPSDFRTSSPMATILSARGRCGEESTLAVYALRTAGLPARQVYTPRWAHCDDNHAWVEVWIEGQWYYMGACEPEGVLDRGWFTEPARRAMLVHSKAFGHYMGAENQIVNEKRYSEINNLGKYATTRTIYVLVTDTEGVPVPDVKVEYQLFNYSEFYPIAVVPTQGIGLSSLKTGLGDLLVWAGSDDKFGFAKVSVSEVDTIKIILNMTPEKVSRMVLDLAVPVVPEPFPLPAKEIMKQNQLLIARGDSIRESYVRSWINRDNAVSFASANSYDTSVVAELIAKSEGNYSEILKFLGNNPEYKDLAVELLMQISEKDLRDTREFILTDHLRNSIEFLNSSEKAVFNEFILNPRVDDELLTDWRGMLKELNRSRLFQSGNASRDNQAAELEKQLSEEIFIYAGENHYGTPLTPKGVENLRISDKQSYNIYLVASFRSVGIPARLEPGTRVPQYLSNGRWLDVSSSDKREGARATVSFQSDGSQPIPEYYKHFTIGRFDNGKYHTLEFDYYKKCTDFPDSISIIPGNYMLVTGNRITDSKILSEISFFSIEEGSHRVIYVNPRNETVNTENYGLFPEGESILAGGGNHKIIDRKTAKGILVVWLDPGMEPSKHFLNDLPFVKGEFEKSGLEIFFLTADKNGMENLGRLRKDIPANAIIGIDPDFTLNSKIRNSLSSPVNSLPMVVMTDSQGSINYFSAGYRIGIAEQILVRTR